MEELTWDAHKPVLVKKMSGKKEHPKKHLRTTMQYNHLTTHPPAAFEVSLKLKPPN